MRVSYLAYLAFQQKKRRERQGVRPAAQRKKR
jgi:hypothetical protein